MFKSILRDRTVWVVVATLFCLGVILSFHLVPLALRWPVRLLGMVAVAWLVFVAVQTLRAVTLTRKKLVFVLILGSLFYAALSLICRVFIGLMSARDDRIATRVVNSLADDQKIGIQAMLDGTSYEMYDRDVGWVPNPGYSREGVVISRQGLRSLREYSIPPPDPEKRILCFGDSFTYGHSVGDTETYPYHAERLRPGTEWVNLGISGACLTQCLLHYRKSGRKFGGRHVVIGFMTDDAKRAVNCFRPFLTAFNPFTKPFAKYSNGVFSIEPNPYQDIADFRRLLANEGPEIERLLKLDYLTWSNQAATRNPILRTAQYVYDAMELDRNIGNLLGRVPQKTAAKGQLPPDLDQRAPDPYGRSIWNPSDKSWTRSNAAVDPYGRAIWRPDSPGFMAVTRLCDLFYNEIIADGRVPLVVIIPGPLDVKNYTRRLPRLYESLMEHFKAKGYRYLDFLDPLVRRHEKDLSLRAIFVRAHYQGSVNKELAEEIINALRLP